MMAVWDRFRRRTVGEVAVAPSTEGRPTRPGMLAREASIDGYAAMSALRDEDTGWQGGVGITGAYPTPSSSEVVATARWLYETNPIASAAIDIAISFLLGDGVRPDSDDPKVAAVLDRHWDDPENDLDIALPDWWRERDLTGTLLLRAHYRNPEAARAADEATNGRILWEMIPVERIASVEHLHARPRVVVLAARPGAQPERLDVVRIDDDPRSPTFGRRIGDCYLITRRADRGTGLGRSILGPAAAWLTAHADFLRARADRARIMNNVIWAVTIEGATDEQLRSKAAESRRPKPNSVLFMSDKQKWDPISPNLGGNDATAEERMIKGMALAGAGPVPEHWLGLGDYANRATAVAMSDPVIKGYSARQREIVHVVRELLRFALDVAIRSGVLRDTVTNRDGEGQPARGNRPTLDAFTITVPEMAPSDNVQVANATTGLVAALATARAEGWIDVDTCQRVLATQLQQVGVDVDLALVRERLAAEEEERAANAPDVPPVDAEDDSADDGDAAPDDGGKA